MQCWQQSDLLCKILVFQDRRVQSLMASPLRPSSFPKVMLFYVRETSAHVSLQPLGRMGKCRTMLPSGYGGFPGDNANFARLNLDPARQLVFLCSECLLQCSTKRWPQRRSPKVNGMLYNKKYRISSYALQGQAHWFS